VFGKMAVVVASMSHVGKKLRETTIFCFSSIVQIAKWLFHGFSLEAVFLLGVWQGYCKNQWRSTWKSPAKGPLSWKKTRAAIQVRAPQFFFFRMHPRNVRTSDEDPGNAPHARAAGSRRRPSPARLGLC
jgi:hypothetical protein